MVSCNLPTGSSRIPVLMTRSLSLPACRRHMAVADSFDTSFSHLFDPTAFGAVAAGYLDDRNISASANIEQGAGFEPPSLVSRSLRVGRAEQRRNAPGPEED